MGMARVAGVFGDADKVCMCADIAVLLFIVFWVAVSPS
jgi:hypothetical protein